MEFVGNQSTQAPPQLPPLRTFIVTDNNGFDHAVQAHTVDFMPNGGVYFVEAIIAPNGARLMRFVAAYQSYRSFTESITASSLLVN